MHELRLLRTRRSGRDPPEAWRAGDHSVLKSRRPALSRNQEKAAPARQKTAAGAGLPWTTGKRLEHGDFTNRGKPR